MKIEILGCSGGKTNTANLPSFLIDGKILLDCGGVCSTLSLNKQLNIEAVFISHSHSDHICDLPFLADNFSIAGKRLVVYASEFTVDVLKNNIFNNRVWPDFTEIPDKDDPVLELKKVKEGDKLTVCDYQFEFFDVYHTEGSIGFLVKNMGKTFAYTADTCKTNGLWEKLKHKGATSVITECSFPVNRSKLAALSKHLSVADFIEEYEQMAGFDNVFVFHLKPHYRDIIEKELSGIKAVILKDGDVIEV